MFPHGQVIIIQSHLELWAYLPKLFTYSKVSILFMGCDTLPSLHFIDTYLETLWGHMCGMDTLLLEDLHTFGCLFYGD